MKEKLRICFFGQKNLSRIGGVEVVVSELATRLAKAGDEVTCINRRAGASLPASETVG